MGMFKPISARFLLSYFRELCERWDEELTQEERDSGDFINPDAPLVLSVPNPEWDGEDVYWDDEFGNSYYIQFHVQSVGGHDEEETEHQGLELIGMDLRE